MEVISLGKYTVFKNHRKEPYFTFVKNGQKTVEGRLKKGEYCNVRPGDHIFIYNEPENENFEVEIKSVRNYGSFLEMLSKEEVKNVLPDVTSIEEGVKIYRKFYTPEDEQKFGVLAIEIKKVE